MLQRLLLLRTTPTTSRSLLGLQRFFHGKGEPKFDSERPVQAVNVKWLESSNFSGVDQDGKMVTMSVSYFFFNTLKYQSIYHFFFHCLNFFELKGRRRSRS